MAHLYNFRERAPKPEGMGPKILRHLKVAKAKNGGHIVTHEFEYNHGPGPSHPDEENVFGAGEGAKVLAHIAKHLGIQQGAAAPAPKAGNALE
jgi:hypothetical protein